MSEEPQPYMPELGQMMHGRPWHELECPEFVVALLRDVDNEFRRIKGNQGGPERDYSPFANHGYSYKNDTFEAHSYWWGEDCACPEDAEGESLHRSECEIVRPNFRWEDVEISWYKWLGRGTTINKPITPERAVEMYNACISSLVRWEREIDPGPH